MCTNAHSNVFQIPIYIIHDNYVLMSYRVDYHDLTRSFQNVNDNIHIFQMQSQTNFQTIQIAIVKCYGAMALQQTQFIQIFVYIGMRGMIAWDLL